MNPLYITYNATKKKLTWRDAVEALRFGHTFPNAEIRDMFLGPAHGTLLSRGAYIEGVGYGVKSTTVFNRNTQKGLPSVQGAMLVFEPECGQLRAIIESRLITEFKTAADSMLGATFLMRPDSKKVLIVGAGAVARSLIEAYSAIFPGLERITVWARHFAQAEALAKEWEHNSVAVVAVTDLGAAASEADAISTATLAREPILKGQWIQPGTHIDLIGAYKADMREADDALITTGSLFVDSRETTLGHIGELTIPIASGVITADDVQGDLYDMIRNPSCGRQASTDITIFKNGGGAHLDLMMAWYICKQAGVER
ncbi:ornithine cyclodeaminase family protein [Desulfovibrio inopinatus]|uniref:ornithine cyclodeaminase family protein n=1 Tax=Desulfovibrio inopinatus TaxID=102109 RepID=UPI00041D2E98|nr:ornithine cyclodeaminase [Desulfovibrio inopinatus]